jgi:hypothetical protein
MDSNEIFEIRRFLRDELDAFAARIGLPVNRDIPNDKGAGRNKKETRLFNRGRKSKKGYRAGESSQTTTSAVNHKQERPKYNANFS